MMKTLLVVTAACGLVTRFASAQSINIDVGANLAPFGVPSATFGAGAGQPGAWNAVTATTPTAQVLFDLSGVPVSATIARTSGAPFEFMYDNPSTSGDDELLLDDAQDIGSQPSSSTWTVSGLQPGHYTTYTYAWAPDNIAYVTSVNGTPVGGAWPGTYAPGITHAVHNFSVAPGGTIVLTLIAVSGYGSLNGLQIVKVDSTVTSYCFGDGSASACPCANAGVAGNGCASSVNPLGGHLSASGLASIAIDTIVLSGSGMPDSSALYFQGSQRVNGGNGVVFGDGLRCAGGNVIRLATKTNFLGSSAYPVPGDIPLSVRGANAAGDVRDYQCWYRNAAAFCTVSTFNLTNAVELVWGP